MLYGYEPFSTVEDNVQGVAAVPTTANPSNPQIGQLSNSDLLSDLDFIFEFKGTFNAYAPGTGLIQASDMFPYIFVSKLNIPYQSGALKIWEDIDGHMAFLINLIRGDNRRGDSRVESDQVPAFNTGYIPQVGDMYSAANYSIAASGTEDYFFRFRVAVAQYFATYLDKIEAVDQKSGQPQVQVNPYVDAYVNFLAMASTGRNIIPTVSLNPVVAGTGRNGPVFSINAPTTAPTWTDTGSNLTIRREGIRTPGAGQAPPPTYPWAPNWKQVSYPVVGSKLSIPVPAEGQLLAAICRLWDPTLNPSGAFAGGGLVDLTGLTGNPVFTFKVGSGIVRYADTARSITERILRMHGNKFPKGCFAWDFAAEEGIEDGLVNGAYVVDTYEVASPTIIIDKGTAFSAGTLCDVGYQFLTGIA